MVPTSEKKYSKMGRNKSKLTCPLQEGVERRRLCGREEGLSYSFTGPSLILEFRSSSLFIANFVGPYNSKPSLKNSSGLGKLAAFQDYGLFFLCRLKRTLKNSNNHLLCQLIY
jgi:hypothetical protein